MEIGKYYFTALAIPYLAALIVLLKILCRFLFHLDSSWNVKFRLIFSDILLSNKCKLLRSSISVLVLWVIPFNTWLISCWEENNFYYKLSNWQNDNCFHSKWQLRPFWVKYMPFYAFAQFVTTFVFFSAWAKSRVKWDNSREPTQKNRTLYASDLNCNYSDNELQM